MEPNRYFNIAEVSAMTPEEARHYHISEKDYWDACTLMNEARKKGIEIGRAEAIAEGRAEEKINVIMGLLEEGLPLEIIARAVKLSVGQVEDIIAKKAQEPDFPKA